MGWAKGWARRLIELVDTLSQRVVRGGFWVFALRITNRLFQLIRTIVLARVLAPSDFGLMGVEMLRADIQWSLFGILRRGGER